MLRLMMRLESQRKRILALRCSRSLAWQTLIFLERRDLFYYSFPLFSFLLETSRGKQYHAIARRLAQFDNFIVIWLSLPVSLSVFMVEKRVLCSKEMGPLRSLNSYSLSLSLSSIHTSISLPVLHLSLYSLFNACVDGSVLGLPLALFSCSLSPWKATRRCYIPGVDVPEGQNDLRRTQLRELALLNGTLREGDGPRCTNCGAADHKAWQCQVRKK